MNEARLAQLKDQAEAAQVAWRPAQKLHDDADHILAMIEILSGDQPGFVKIEFQSGGANFQICESLPKWSTDYRSSFLPMLKNLLLEHRNSMLKEFHALP